MVTRLWAHRRLITFCSDPAEGVQLILLIFILFAMLYCAVVFLRTPGGAYDLFTNFLTFELCCVTYECLGNTLVYMLMTVHVLIMSGRDAGFRGTPVRTDY